MDLGMVAALAMLAVWLIATVFFDAPGWVHLLLTVGVFLLVWRTIHRRGATPDAPARRHR